MVDFAVDDLAGLFVADGVSGRGGVGLGFLFGGGSFGVPEACLLFAEGAIEAAGLASRLEFWHGSVVLFFWAESSLFDVLEAYGVAGDGGVGSGGGF